MLNIYISILGIAHLQSEGDLTESKKKKNPQHLDFITIYFSLQVFCVSTTKREVSVLSLTLIVFVCFHFISITNEFIY